MVEARRWVRLMMADVSDSMVVVVCGIGSVWGCRIGREVKPFGVSFVCWFVSKRMRRRNRKA